MRAFYSSSSLPIRHDFRSKRIYNRLGKYSSPGGRTAIARSTDTPSRWFYPEGIVVGSTMTVGAGDEYSLDGVTFISTAFTWVAGTRLKLQTASSGTYEAETEATLLDDGVVVSTFTVTAPAESVINVITDVLGNPITDVDGNSLTFI